jgi:hypothetical protein
MGDRGWLISPKTWLMHRLPRRLVNLIFSVGLGVFTGSAAANATPTLELVSGTVAPVQVAAGPSGATTYSNQNFDGWDVIISFGTSNSPDLSPYGLDLVDLVETCWRGTGCASDPLEIYLSDTGFTQTTGAFVQSYSTTGAGVASQTAYVDTSNTVFGTTAPTSQQLGTITLTNTGADSVAYNLAVPVGPSPYSLTLADTYEPNGGAGVVFSSDGNITIPEPTSLILFASSLMGFGWFDRRRKQSWARAGQARQP